MGRNGFAARVVTALLIFGMFFLLAYIVWKSVQILLLVFAGILFAVILRAVSQAVSCLTGMSVRWALSLVLVCGLVLGGLAVWFAVPRIARELQVLGEKMSVFLSEFAEWLERLPGGSEVAAQAFLLQDHIVNGGDLLQRVGGVFFSTFGALGGVLLVTLIGIFLAYDPRLYQAGLLRLVPLTKRGRASEILIALGKILQSWLWVQAISMAFLFASMWVMLALLGVPLAFLLALLTGLMTFVPYMGPLIAVVPILLVSFMAQPILALYAGVLYLVIQNFEENIMMPLICQRTVHLPAVLTIVGQLVLGGVFGALGFMLATPLMAVGLVLVQSMYVEHFLGDSMERRVKELSEFRGA
jgi:predicted PurR-regulated permease PerM